MGRRRYDRLGPPEKMITRRVAPPARRAVIVCGTISGTPGLADAGRSAGRTGRRSLTTRTVRLVVDHTARTSWPPLIAGRCPLVAAHRWALSCPVAAHGWAPGLTAGGAVTTSSGPSCGSFNVPWPVTAIALRSHPGWCDRRHDPTGPSRICSNDRALAAPVADDPGQSGGTTSSTTPHHRLAPRPPRPTTLRA